MKRSAQGSLARYKMVLRRTSQVAARHRGLHLLLPQMSLALSSITAKLAQASETSVEDLVDPACLTLHAVTLCRALHSGQASTFLAHFLKRNILDEGACDVLPAVAAAAVPHPALPCSPLGSKPLLTPT